MTKRVEYIMENELSKSLKVIFQTMLDSDLNIEDVNKDEAQYSYDNSVVGCIDISGVLKEEKTEDKFSAEARLNFPKEVYLKMASRMLMEDFDDINDENDDVASEIANMIIGNAKAGLCENGINSGMESPKSLINPSISELNSRVCSSGSFLEVSSDFGVFYMEILFTK